jgi:cyclopropane-fatty-acyl-phospholipid synthase
MSAEQTIRQLLAEADVKINGPRPSDLQVLDDRFYGRVLHHRELGLGESYMDGWWSSRALDELIAKVLSADLRNKVRISPEMAWAFVVSTLANRQTITGAKKNASHHYNIGNDLYERMLDKRMVYSCGYWRNAKNLDQAQDAKLDLICRKLHLKKGMKVLDIGCGWGGFSKFAAEKYGAIVTGISPAAEQVKLARKRTKGLPVTIKQLDYRDVKGKYDRIVSIGMLEHVGNKNYPAFFSQCLKLLKPDGLMLHHTIGANHTTQANDPWIDKYIFPGGHLPSLAELTKVTQKQFIIEDIHNFGPDYDKTLMAWHANFTKHYKEIKDEYDERFYLMWTYYLLVCAGLFRARHAQLWQIVMRPIVRSDTYESVR